VVSLSHLGSTPILHATARSYISLGIKLLLLLTSFSPSVLSIYSSNTSKTISFDNHHSYMLTSGAHFKFA
jgi:hypothetical protein